MNQWTQKSIRNHSAVKSGRVVSVNDDGTLTVRMKGRDTTITLPNTSGRNLASGSDVTLMQYEGDSQKMTVSGWGAFRGSDQAIS